ncbi:hypothetical protein DFH08DRAFT_507633 [Mycena albidolilacea]|uniref:DUF6533 domain-containing protein n=1 Tax=Mycena albidolilacea TaxID=1033008 RepID=A0AAD7ADG0_9AGAR|nr:hypothetical protein DFH08DRAFT_507633 [Mycena albidolilacea]
MDLFNATGAVTTIQIIRSGVLAVYFLAIYEWLETLPTEIELIHPSRWNSIKVAYLLCRYYQLLVWPLVIYAYDGNHTAQTCSKLTEIVTCFLLPMQLFAPGVMLMRAYAFAGRNIRVLVLLLVFYAALIGIDVWFFCFNVVLMPDIAYELPGGAGCFPDYAANNGGERLVISMSASLVMDLVSLSIIIVYCLRTHSTRGSLGRLFISQGLGSFGVVLMVHGVALGLYFSPHTYYNGIGLPYILVISNLMACRLILDLRRKALPTETEILRQNSFIVNQAIEGSDFEIHASSQDIWQTGLVILCTKNQIICTHRKHHFSNSFFGNHSLLHSHPA